MNALATVGRESNAVVLRNRPPAPGAIQLLETSAIGRAGDWLDLTTGSIVNLSRTADRLPMAAPRSVNMFAGSTLGVADVHETQPIAGWLSEYENGQFLLDKVVQMQMVDYSIFSYRSHAKSNTFLVHDVRAATQDAPPEVNIDTSVAESKTQDMRVAIFVPYRTETQADFDVRRMSARKIWTAVALWREWSAFGTGGTFMSSSNWASSVTQAMGATYNWGPVGASGADSDPIRDLTTGQQNSLSPITMWVMNEVQASWFLRHPVVIDYYKTYNPGGDTKGLAAAIAAAASDRNMMTPMTINLPGIAPILVHTARATTDPAVAPSRMWSNDIVVGFSHAMSMPPNSDVATAVNFRLKNPTNGTQTGAMLPEGVAMGGWTVRVVPVPLRGAGGDLMIVDLSERIVMTANDTGGFISGVS